ncbi:MAG: trehalose-phosphatase [Pyrobaculum sp.]
MEEKTSSLAWHFRNVEPEIGEATANRLVEALSDLVGGAGAAVLRGKKVVEVRPAGVNKGAAAKLLAERFTPGSCWSPATTTQTRRCLRRFQRHSA